MSGEKDGNAPHPGNARFGTVLDHLREGVQILDRQWRYLYLNDAACRHGRRTRDELLGRTLTEAYPGVEGTDMFATLERCMRERTPEEAENEFTFPDGSTCWFELRAEPVEEGIFVLSIDIQERKSLEAQLLHAQRMEAIGCLAGGVAHDFNNLLTAIRGFGVLARDALDPAHPARADLEETLRAASRAETLVAQLLAFSRRRNVQPQVIDVNHQVADMDAMLRRVLGAHVELASTLAEDLWSVRIDPGAFEQVLVNLAVNARDAMPGGGKLTVETANVELDDSYAMAKGGIVIPGQYVALSVTDNGHGMDAVTRASIFEPFFTTKPRDLGTGLGLSTCYGIIKQAGGYIWVYSEPGSGTTFKVYLPRVRREPDAKARDEAPSAARGSETVLVVEDDSQVRRLAARALAAQGYAVLEAGTGADALDLLRTEGLSIDVLLTDVVMPQMSGRELAERISAEYSGLKVLFMTGYTEDAVVHQGVLDPGVALIPKPFTPGQLARRVRELLDA